MSWTSRRLDTYQEITMCHVRVNQHSSLVYTKSAVSLNEWTSQVCLVAEMAEDNGDFIAVVICLLVIVGFLVVISTAIPTITPFP